MRTSFVAGLLAVYLAPTLSHAWVATHARRRYAVAAPVGFAQLGTTQTTSQNSASSIVLTKPTGVTNGTVVYVFLYSRNSGNAPLPPDPTPSGWTKLAGQNFYDSGSNLLAVYRRVSDGSDASTYTFTFSGGHSYSMGAVMAFSGLDTTNPEDRSPVIQFGTTSGSTVTIMGSPISSASAQVIAGFVDAGGATGLTAPPGYNSAWSMTNGSANLEFQGYQSASAVSGNPSSITTGNWPNGVTYGTVLLAVKRP